MTEFFAELAVDAMRDYYAANLQAQLTLVETASGLSAGDLPPPDEYIKGFIPTGQSSPYLMVYDDGLVAIEQRPGMYTVRVGVGLVFNGDADVVAGQVKIRRYLTAMLWTVLKAPTLGGTDVVQCFLNGADREGVIDATSETRHAYFIDWEVSIYQPV